MGPSTAERSLPCYRIRYPSGGISSLGRCLWECTDEAGKVVQRERVYRFDDGAFLPVLLRPLPPALADLNDVARAVSTIDRLSPRRIATAGWLRELHLQVPVRDVDRWTSVRRQLETLLWRYTEDRWTLEFVPRSGDGRSAELQAPLFALAFDRRLAVCLFSGGLDSLSGAVAQLLGDVGCHLICVSGTTNDWLGQRQAHLVRSLADRFGGRITPLSVSFEMEQPRTSWPEEATQRTRGFVHAAFGASAAVLAETGELVVHENGVGALNLPYDRTQLGARMTRATHPLLLSELGAWLTAYLGRPFRVVGSSLGLTKGQACGALVEAGLQRLVERTFSCDGVQRVAGRPQCGTCTSCLLRRQAIYAAGLAEHDPVDRYRFDVTDRARQVPLKHRAGLALMLAQLATLRRCVHAEDPWSELLGAFPSLWELESRADEWRAVGGPGAPSATLVGLYRAYVDEWSRFPVIPPFGRGVSDAAAAAA